MSQDYENEEIASIALEITEYLKAHQDAADSLEGIANWWLKRQRLEQSVEDIHNVLQSQEERGLIKKALDLLEKRGVVRTRLSTITGSHKPIYSYANSNSRQRRKDLES